MKTAIEILRERKDMAYRTVFVNDPEGGKDGGPGPDHGKPMRLHAVDARECLENGSAVLENPLKKGRKKKKVESKAGTADLTSVGDDNLEEMEYDDILEIAKQKGVESPNTITDKMELISAIRAVEDSMASQAGVQETNG
jgi:hypothetical protein